MSSMHWTQPILGIFSILVHVPTDKFEMFSFYLIVCMCVCIHHLLVYRWVWATCTCAACLHMYACTWRAEAIYVVFFDFSPPCLGDGISQRTCDFQIHPCCLSDHLTPLRVLESSDPWFLQWAGSKGWV